MTYEIFKWEPINSDDEYREFIQHFCKSEKENGVFLLFSDDFTKRNGHPYTRRKDTAQEHIDEDLKLPIRFSMFLPYPKK